MSKILLLEDDSDLVDGLVYSLEKNGFEVEAVRTAREAMSRLRHGQHPFDLLLLDVTLPDGTGFEVCDAVRAAHDGTPVIFLTAADEETSIIRGLDKGGDDYITKPFRLGELCSRIRALLRRSAMQDNAASGQLHAGPVAIDQLAGRAFLHGDALELTGAEYRLLCLLVQHRGQILTRAAILNALWDGNGSFVDDNTLSVYMRRLREKVEKDPSRPEYLRTVRGVGYRWEERP